MNAQQFSQIHQRWFKTNEIIEDMVTETELTTSLEELNQVMRRGLCRMKKEVK